MNDEPSSSQYRIGQPQAAPAPDPRNRRSQVQRKKTNSRRMRMTTELIGRSLEPIVYVSERLLTLSSV